MNDAAARPAGAMVRLVRRLVDVRSLPSSMIVTIAVASYGGLILATVAGWPLWGKVLAALLPWGMVFAKEAVWIHRHHGMLSLFYLLVLTQGGHLLEHTIQFIQVFVFDLSGPDASGVFSALDIEWVHFIWNTWVLLATIPLLLRFRNNRWLWLAGIAAVWHEAEHIYLIIQYLTSGQPGDPGLLANGGVIAGGLPLSRVALHFYYNVVESLPLFIAFGVALKELRNEWLAEAFAGADDATIVDVSAQAVVERVSAGHVLVREGAPSSSFYVISKGTFEVLRGQGDDEVLVTELGPGDPVGEIGLLEERPRSASVRATTDGEVVRVDREQFLKVMASSDDARIRLETLASARAGGAVS